MSCVFSQVFQIVSHDLIIPFRSTRVLPAMLPDQFTIWFNQSGFSSGMLIILRIILLPKSHPAFVNYYLLSGERVQLSASPAPCFCTFPVLFISMSNTVFFRLYGTLILQMSLSPLALTHRCVSGC